MSDKKDSDRFSIRVWNKKERKMYYNEHSFNDIEKDKDNLIPMLSAMRKDITNKLIYEGDLLTVKQTYKATSNLSIMEDSTVEVVWDKEIEAMCVMGNDINLNKPSWRTIYYLSIGYFTSEIVGNIYENPEILENEKRGIA